MGLMRWFRRYNKKLMVAIVFLAIVAFVLGDLFQLRRGGLQGKNEVVANFGDGQKITNYDLFYAQQELQTLQALRADMLLRNVPLPIGRTPDLEMLMLSELLFSEQRISPEVIDAVKQFIKTNDYSISSKQINDIYRKTASSSLYWLLLQKESQQAGFKISDASARSSLAETIPALYKNASYSQVMNSLTNNMGISEDRIVSTFAKLLAVCEYARTVCSEEDITTRQIMQTVSRQEETVNAELVKFNSSLLSEKQRQPSEQEIQSHFDKYKKYSAGEVSEENPYGFGYKLPDRVGLEYIAVKLKDLSAKTPKPTQQELEDYYQANRDLFTMEVPLDPNDPNSPPTKQIRRYSEVVNLILGSLLNEKINSTAEKILQQARSLTEEKLSNIDTNSTGPTSRQFEELAGDYKEAAEKLSKEYNVTVYAGQTGLFDAVDMQTDDYLKMLYLSDSARNPAKLMDVVFAIDELGISELGPYDAVKPKMYENIGPLKDISGKIMAVIRVNRITKSAEPENINVTYSRQSLNVGQGPIDENIYSVKTKIAEDLKALAAMKSVKAQSEELISLANKEGWEKAIEKINKSYSQPFHAAAPAADANALKVLKLTGLSRISKAALQRLAVQKAGNPLAQAAINRKKVEALLVDNLYSLIPPGAETAGNLPLVMEFKPTMSFYVIKSLSINPVDTRKYEYLKTMYAYKNDLTQSQSLTVLHYNPENILKRMNFKWVKQEKPKTAEEAQ
jgi:hypothetical protein